MRIVSFEGKRRRIIVFTYIMTMLFVLLYHIKEDQYEDDYFNGLLDDYYRKLRVLTQRGYWTPSVLQEPCSNQHRTNITCVDTNCSAKPKFNLVENLQSVLNSMSSLDEGLLHSNTEHMRVDHAHSKLLFLTAASSNHFSESLFLIQNLRNFVFPLLRNFSFVYYDLGLSSVERLKIKNICNCEVRTFPVSLLPSYALSLTCYTWKPLIIHANIQTADALIWMDTSVRFSNSTVLDLLAELGGRGFSFLWGYYPMAHHIHKNMFEYFNEQTCSFSQIAECQSGMVALVNDRFNREVIVKPWVACALDERCMCPREHAQFLNCFKQVENPYNKCHRFDQSALGIILVKLFRGHENSVKVAQHILQISRYTGQRLPSFQ